MQEEYANELIFISHAGLHKDHFAMRLRRELGACGITAFVDERDIETGQSSGPRMKAATQNAKLVIFVITREFLSSSYCMDELRWALEQRERSSVQLPMILPILYSSGSVRGYTRAELEVMSLTNRQEVMEMLTMGTINIGDLSPLNSSLRKLIEQHSPPSQKDQLLGSEERNIGLEQRLQDLKELTRICCQRADACPRWP